MVNALDNALMQKALDAAWHYQVLTFPNPAVGAVVSNDAGEILGMGAHRKAGTPHAEVLALKEAYLTLTHDTRIEALSDSMVLHLFLKDNHQDLFSNLSLHVTLEPCHHFGKTPPCSSLIEALGIKRVVIGSYDESLSAKGGGAYLQSRGVEVSFGCLKEACDTLLTPFTCKEKKEPFIFYKLALSANNVATGGTITSLESRTMVHRLRDCCDLMVIGGNTVRVDRPTLDARLCEGKAPDILIYSHENTFDRTIPLFQCPSRKVFIEKSLERIREYRMVMIEGGASMLKAMEEQVEWYLIFRSPYIKEGEEIKLPERLKEIFSCAIGEDRMSWYRRVGE